MTKAKAKEQPALFEQEQQPHVEIREGNVKKNTNPPPTTERPPAPKSQVAPKKPGTAITQVEPQRPMRALDALAAALAKAQDPAKMRELFQLHQDTEGKQLFHDALLEIDFPSINRDGKIPVSGGKALRFASFENVHKAIMPLLRQHRFRMSFQPGPAPSGEGMVVTCRLIRGTYEESCMVPMSIVSASRAMNSQQAIGAAIKYASRYGMMYLLNLRSEAPEDRDTDGNLPRPSTKKGVAEPQAAGDGMEDGEDGIQKINGSQEKTLLAEIAACGVKSETFLKHWQIAAVKDLPLVDFDAAVQACKTYGEKHRKQNATRP